MPEDKSFIDRFFDKIDDGLDKARVLRKIGTPEEEEAEAERSRTSNLVAGLSSEGYWHIFVREKGADDSLCGGTHNVITDADEHAMPLPSGQVVKFCSSCLCKLGLSSKGHS